MFESFNQILNTPEAKFAQKSLDYLDGKIYHHVIQMLDEPNSGRAQWKEKGLRPIYRNIVRKIVTKSGLIFIKGKPDMEVWDNDSMNEYETAIYNAILNDAEFNEFMINFDSVIRLLKTGMILVQYDPIDDKILLETLHRGNSFVHVNPITKRVDMLVYKTFQDGNACYYRVFTNDKIEDFKESSKPGAKPELINTEDNVYNTIPVSVFYDTHIPRVGYWNEAPQELVIFNETLNMHMIDTEFAASWSVHQTLFTNMSLDGSADEQNLYAESGGESYQQKLPRVGGGSNAIVGGLGKIVEVNSSGVENPFLEYKAPSIDLTQSHGLFTDWVKDYASDWSVRARVDGDGSNVSGFSLVVRETDNLELRQERQRMFEQGLDRLFKSVSTVWNTYHPQTFDEDATLNTSFVDPKLPFDQKEDEDIWSIRITEGRASTIDYLMDKHGIDRDEAIEMQQRIDDENFTAGTVPVSEIPRDAEQRVKFSEETETKDNNTGE